MHPIIRIQDVHKSFKEVKALQGVSFDIKEGEFIALLGPNGAGKTTLIEMIEGLRKPDTGHIIIDNKEWDPKDPALQQLLGVAFQETRFIDKLTVKETVDLFASFYGLSKTRVDEVIALVKLEEKQKSYTVNLSGGQRQRMALAIALLNKPKILLLDEPTTGLDPASRREVWKILNDLKNGETSMILTTHYMEEAEYLCDRIIILNQGKIISQGTLAELLGEHKNLDELFLALTGQKIIEF